MRQIWCSLAAGVLLCAFVAFGAEPPGSLRWDREARRVDADIQGWTLEHTLRRIATATGWSVYVEPGLSGTVAARFERRPERQALATLLGDLSFALLPQPGNATRLLVFQSSATRATDPIQVPTSQAASTNALPNEVIVRLKRGSKINIEELARQLGGRVAGSLSGLDAYRLVFDDAETAKAARDALAANEDVASTEANYALDRPSPIEPTTGAPPTPRLKARPITDNGSVVIALLDTAISTSGLENTDFLLPGLTIGPSGGTDDGALTHGSAMFETILQGLSAAQQAEEGQAVRVLPVDIYGGYAETSTFELAQGIIAALEHGADIINLSLSGPAPSPLVQEVLRQAAAAGVMTFAAPGNEPTTAPTFPAAYPEVVAVTAGDRHGGIAPYANRGSFVDLIAPGTSVVPYGGESWIVHGTSVATAYTAGLAAGLLADTGRPPADIIAELRQKLGFNPAPGRAP